MPERILRRLVRARGWLIPAALLAAAPKCVLCVLAYAGIGTVLGFSGPEICGAATETGPWAGLLPAFSVVSGTIGYFAWDQRRHAARLRPD